MHIPVLVERVRVKDRAGLFLVTRVDYDNLCAHVVPLLGFGHHSEEIAFDLLYSAETVRAVRA